MSLLDLRMLIQNSSQITIMQCDVTLYDVMLFLSSFDSSIQTNVQKRAFCSFFSDLTMLSLRKKKQYGQHNLLLFALSSKETVKCTNISVPSLFLNI